MGSKSGLGPFQQQILYVLLSLRENAYGMSIWQELEDRTGEAVTIGLIFRVIRNGGVFGQTQIVRSEIGEQGRNAGGVSRLDGS